MPDDGNRYEVVDGQLLVTPLAAFGHQRTAVRLIRALDDYCAPNALGEVVGPGAVIRDDNELQPDVQVVPGVGHPRGVKWTDLPLPVLVGEILSDSTKRRDFGIKRDAYLALGIAHYWVVDGDACTVTIWSGRADPLTVSDVIRWQPSSDITLLEIRVETILGAA